MRRAKVGSCPGEHATRARPLADNVFIAVGKLLSIWPDHAQTPAATYSAAREVKRAVADAVSEADGLVWAPGNHGTGVNSTV